MSLKTTYSFPRHRALRPVLDWGLSAVSLATSADRPGDTKKAPTGAFFVGIYERLLSLVLTGKGLCVVHKIYEGIEVY